jgi:uncharacterized protein (DUF1501 family)
MRVSIRRQRCEQYADPFDTAGYANYSKIRGPLAIPQSQLLQLSAMPNFALNPNLPDIQTLFDNKNAAFVANVGTLIEPTTKAQFQAGTGLPTNLFSHPDQQLEWQNAAQSGSPLHRDGRAELPMR